MGLTHSISFGHVGSLNLTLTQTHTAAQFGSGAQSSTSAYLIFVLPLDFRRAATLTAVGGSGSGAPANEVVASLTQSPPVGPGSGYRLSLSTAGNYDADWRQQFRADLNWKPRVIRDSRAAAPVVRCHDFLDGQLNTTRSVNGSRDGGCCRLADAGVRAIN